MWRGAARAVKVWGSGLEHRCPVLRAVLIRGLLAVKTWATKAT